MIPNYFLLSEVLGYFGLFLLVINVLLILPYYIKLFKANTRTVSWVWLGINSFLMLVQIIMAILFLIILIEPSAISDQGKIDEGTAKDFITISLVLLVVTLTSTIINVFVQNYFGAFIKGNDICLSYSTYQMDEINSKKKSIYFGERAKYKNVIKKSKVGKFLIEFLQQQNN